MDLVVQALVNGLVSGTLLAVPAIGFTAMFAVLRFPNFSVSGVATLGAFAGYLAYGAGLQMAGSLVVAFAVAGAADDVPVYQTETGERTAACKGHKGTYAVAFSPNGEQLATGGFDGKVRVCEVKSGKLVRDFVPVPVETLAAAAK